MAETRLEHWPWTVLPRLLRGDWTPTADQIASYERFASEGDPVADALVHRMKADGSGPIRRQLDVALDRGIAAVPDAPPELRAFVASLENVPFWLDEDLLARASRVHRRLGPFGFPLFLIGFASTYTAPEGNAVLMRAGETRSAAGRRAFETLSWFVDVTSENGLRRGAPGHQACARIRLTHAFIRSGMQSRADWNLDRDGYPVNQQVYSSVIVVIAIVPVLGGLILGSWATAKDREAVFHLWRYVAHLVGVHPDLIPTDQNDFLRLLWLMLSQTLSPDESTTVLGTALIDAYPEIYGVDGPGRAHQAARWALREVHGNLARLVLGSEIADALGFGRLSPLAVPVIGIAAVNLTVSTALRTVPGGRALHLRAMGAAQDRGVAAMRRRLKPDLSYTRE